jgi:acetate kinase
MARDVLHDGDGAFTDERGTRSGAIDPGVILYLPSERGMSIDEVTDLLYHRSGLLGVSGMSNDMRNLLASPAREAADAVYLLVYRIGRDLGSLTAGIGEHAAPVRAPRCGRQSRGWAANQLSVRMIPTNEEMMIASHTLACIRP